MFEQDIDVSLSRDKLIVTKLIHSGLFKGGFMPELFVWSTDFAIITITTR